MQECILGLPAPWAPCPCRQASRSRGRSHGRTPPGPPASSFRCAMACSFPIALVPALYLAYLHAGAYACLKAWQHGQRAAPSPSRSVQRGSRRRRSQQCTSPSSCTLSACTCLWHASPAHGSIGSLGEPQGACPQQSLILRQGGAEGDAIKSHLTPAGTCEPKAHVSGDGALGRGVDDK